MYVWNHIYVWRLVHNKNIICVLTYDKEILRMTDFLLEYCFRDIVKILYVCTCL